MVVEQVSETNRLTVTFRADEIGAGELTAYAVVDGFAGRSSAYFNVDKLLEFANAILAYPLPDDPISLASGFGPPEGELDQEHVGLVVHRIGTKGQLGVVVHLATPLWNDGRSEPLQEVRLELLTSYEHLATFGRDFIHVAQAELPEAELLGDVLT